MIAEHKPREHQDKPVIQDPHCFVHCASYPSLQWAQHQNGVFRTSNAGEHWERFEDIDSSTFGFAVAVHPTDGSTTWLVPSESDEVRIPIDGRIVVTRTRNGEKAGSDWKMDCLSRMPTISFSGKHSMSMILGIVSALA